MARKHYRQEFHGNPYGFSRMSREEILAVQATLGLNDNSRVPSRQFHAAVDQFATQQLREGSPVMLERIESMQIDGHKPSAEQKAIMKVQAMMGFVDPSSWGLTQSDVDTIKQMSAAEFEKFSGAVTGVVPQADLTDKQKAALSHLQIGGEVGPMDAQQALKYIHDRRIIDGKFGKVTHAAMGNLFEPNEAGQVAGLDAPTQQTVEQTAPAAPVTTAAAPTGGLGPYNGPMPQARPTTEAPAQSLGQTVQTGVTNALGAAGDFFGTAFNGAVNLGGEGIDKIKQGAAVVADTFTPKEETKPTEPAAKQDGRLTAKPQAGKAYSYKTDINHERGGRVPPTRVNEQTPEQVGQLIGAKTRPGMEPDTVQIEVPRGADPQAYREQLVLSIAMGRGGSEDAFARSDANIGTVQNLKGANGATQSYISAPLGAFSTTNVQEQLKADAKAQNGVFFPAMNPAFAAAQKPAAAKPTATAAKPAGQTPVGAAPAPVEVAATNGPRPIAVPVPRARPEMTASAEKPAADKPVTPQGVNPVLTDPVLMAATGAANLIAPTVDGGAFGQATMPGAGFTQEQAAPAAAVATPAQGVDTTQQIAAADLPIGGLAPTQQQPAAAVQQPQAAVPPAEQGWFSATAQSMSAALNAINPFGEPAQAATTQPAAAVAPQVQQSAAPQTPPVAEASATPALSVADIAANINSYGVVQNNQSDMSKALGEIADRYGRGEMEKAPLAGGLNPAENFRGFQSHMEKQIRAAEIPGQDAYLLSSLYMAKGGQFDLSEKNIKEVLARAGHELKPGSVSDKIDAVKVGIISGDASFREFVSLLDPRTGKLVQPEITTKDGSHIKPWYDVGRPVGMDKGKWDALKPDERHQQGTKLPPGVTAEAWEKIDSDDTKKTMLQNHRETQLADRDKLVGYAPALSAIDPADYARFKDANFRGQTVDNNAVVVSGETYRALVAAAKDPKAMAAFLPVPKGNTAAETGPRKTMEERKADAAKASAKPAYTKADMKAQAAAAEADALAKIKAEEELKKANAAKTEKKPTADKPPADKPDPTKQAAAKPEQKKEEPKKKSCLLGGPGCS